MSSDTIISLILRLQPATFLDSLDNKTLVALRLISKDVKKELDSHIISITLKNPPPYDVEAVSRRLFTSCRNISHIKIVESKMAVTAQQEKNGWEARPYFPSCIIPFVNWSCVEHCEVFCLPFKDCVFHGVEDDDFWTARTEWTTMQLEGLASNILDVDMPNLQHLVLDNLSSSTIPRLVKKSWDKLESLSLVLDDPFGGGLVQNDDGDDLDGDENLDEYKKMSVVLGRAIHSIAPAVRSLTLGSNPVLSGFLEKEALPSLRSLTLDFDYEDVTSNRHMMKSLPSIYNNQLEELQLLGYRDAGWVRRRFSTSFDICPAFKMVAGSPEIVEWTKMKNFTLRFELTGEYMEDVDSPLVTPSPGLLNSFNAPNLESMIFQVNEGWTVKQVETFAKIVHKSPQQWKNLKQFTSRFFNEHFGFASPDELEEMQRDAASAFGSLLEQLPPVSTLSIESYYTFPRGGSFFDRRPPEKRTHLKKVESLCNSMLKKRGSDQKMVVDETKDICQIYC